MKTRVHISLPVSDLTSSVRFYQDLFGEGPSTLKEDYANFRLQAPALHLSLVRHPEPPPSSGHFGVEVFSFEDLKTWRSRLGNSDLNVEIEENVACCYAVSDKVWATDPDGRRWEVYTVLEDDAPSLKDETSECCADTCCTGTAET